MVSLAYARDLSRYSRSYATGPSLFGPTSQDTVNNITGETDPISQFFGPVPPKGQSPLSVASKVPSAVGERIGHGGALVQKDVAMGAQDFVKNITTTINKTFGCPMALGKACQYWTWIVIGGIATLVLVVAKAR